MYSIGDTVKIIHNGTIGAIIGIELLGETSKYKVLVNGKQSTFFDDQIEPFDTCSQVLKYSAKDVNSLLTARLILNPSVSSLYSLNSAKIDYIPYQFRPVLKIIKSDSPRILIADGVGVGKTIEAGLVLKELQARFDIKSVMVICPRPLITESKWQEELKRFGEKFVHLDGKQLRYCINESELDDGEWPVEYQRCIVPYSLFDEALVFGSADGGATKLEKKCLADLNPFPKFDLVIIDVAHHIKNPNTYAYQAAQLFCENAESIVMLTATPIQLGDKDLFVLLNLLRPDLVIDYESFQHMSEPNPYINEAVRHIRSNHSNWKNEALINLLTAGSTPWGLAMLVSNPNYKNAIRLLQENTISSEQRVKLISDVESLHTFAHIINRTRRRDIGNFTLRKPETLKVEFTDEQAELYDRLMETQANILMQLHGDRGIRFMMTTIMRQAASCIHGLKPFLHTILTRRFDELEFCGLTPDDSMFDSSVYEKMSVPEIMRSVQEILEMATEISPVDHKFDALLSTIEGKQKMANNKVIVFSSFRHTLHYLHEKLLSQGVRVGLIHGGIKDYERVILRNRFKLDKSSPDALDVLLFSEVGCEGLDYQFCDCMVNYDLPWNPQAIEQRIGRIDRNGQQSESVSIINIITENTIDCDIYDRCLLRIGVFNSSIGDSEEILGDITREIYDICEKYILNPKERQEKLQQLQDNKVRLMLEQQKMEDEKHTFFGLDMSENHIKKELENATNIHLSADSIYRLVETYLEKRLGEGTTYILGDGRAKTLRLNVDNRRLLYEDYCKLPKQANPVYKAWDDFLNNTIPFEKVTFDGQYAADHPEVVFIMPTHPLVKQALSCFDDDPVFASLKVRTETIPAGEYPFIIYEWLYKGVKPDNKLQVITTENLPNNLVLEAIYSAFNGTMDATTANQTPLEELHYQVWQSARDNYKDYASQIIGFKKESLISSQLARQKTIEDRLSKETDPRIIRMKKSQLSSQRLNFVKKMDGLDKQINQSDILAKKLVVGIIEVM